jgi:hypothetical protein
MKGANEPRLPIRASVPIAVHTWASRVKWTASFNASAATLAEKAVPFNIPIKGSALWARMFGDFIPRCSFDAREMGSILCAARATREETILRDPKAGGPSNARIEGLPTIVTLLSGKLLARTDNAYLIGLLRTTEAINLGSRR